MPAPPTRRIASCLSWRRVKVGDQRVDLGAPLRRGEALIADQVLALHDLQQPRPMLGIGGAGVDVDAIVGAAATAGIDADRRMPAADRP
jgi:hypothetical protein